MQLNLYISQFHNIIYIINIIYFYYYITLNGVCIIFVGNPGLFLILNLYFHVILLQVGNLVKSDIFSASSSDKLKFVIKSLIISIF